MSSNLGKLLSITAQLRDKENGCPWDIAQTFASIIPCTLEETYEVVDAIERNHMHDLKDELGDLLFQVVLYAQMASEENLFSFDDIVDNLCTKLVTRHPHVFGDKNANSVDDVMDIWQSTKDSEEKNQRPKESILDDVPMAFPALLRAQKLSKKAAKTGFEWQETEDVIDKIIEELNEFRDTLGTDDTAHKQEELGDVLFSVVQLGRRLDLDCEDTLRKANAKFYRRFSGMEKSAKRQNKDLKLLSPEEWDDLWTEQKKTEKA